MATSSLRSESTWRMASVAEADGFSAGFAGGSSAAETGRSGRKVMTARLAVASSARKRNRRIGNGSEGRREEARRTSEGNTVPRLRGGLLWLTWQVTVGPPAG